MSFLRHPCFAQAGEERVVELGDNSWHSKVHETFPAGDARVKFLAAQFSGCIEFRAGGLGVALKGIRGGKIRPGMWQCRVGIARPLEPQNRLVSA